MPSLSCFLAYWLSDQLLDSHDNQYVLSSWLSTSVPRLDALSTHRIQISVNFFRKAPCEVREKRESGALLVITTSRHKADEH